jgi:hypothetical protein
MSQALKNNKVHQKLPTNFHDREKLREKGQFWTPEWVACPMVFYAVKDSTLLFDPAVGNGAFYNALNIVNTNKTIRFYGTDIDKDVIDEVRKGKNFDRNNCTLELRDFIFSPPSKKFKSIVANPPYIRHHRLSLSMKNKLREMTKLLLGFTIDARAGLHIYFLIQALNLLDSGGRLAFIMPADTCEGIFAKRLWSWIAGRFCLEAVITFAPDATPFPRVDTNALIFLIKNTKSVDKIYWVRSRKAQSNDLYEFIKSDFKKTHFPTLKILKRELKEALETGLSRPPVLCNNYKYRLSDFAKVMRGIATGGNGFFHLTATQAKEIGISKEFLLPAIGRTRDVANSCVTTETLKKLEENGRPTLLFSPDGRRLEKFPKKVQEYIQRGETMGLPKRALIMTRSPWYKMEKREVPPFLFAYLGRRNARFIKNEAGVVPLTGFLCIYPHSQEKSYINKLWNVLQHPDVLKNLNLVAKSYGAGAIKVEPRALERLPLPEHIVEQYNLKISKAKNKQFIFF